MIRTLAAPFGAEVTSFDLVRLTAAEKTRLVRALHRHLLLVFRDQSLSFDDQIALTAVFGDADERVRRRDLPFRHPDDSRIQVVSNDPRAPAVTRSTVFWHTDQSYDPHPAPVIVLKAVVLPPSGGTTMFADMRAAHDQLSARDKAEVAALRARHAFGALLGAAAVTTGARGGTVHPLVRRHPVTKRRSLYLNQFSLHSVLGVPRKKGAELLARLYAHALKPEFIYAHTWRSGDVLVWDNLSLMHRVADVPTSPRLLHRTHTRAE
jgi:taurine dioxygenase